jgi:hypothetical protein
MVRRKIKGMDITSNNLILHVQLQVGKLQLHNTEELVCYVRRKRTYILFHVIYNLF